MISRTEPENATIQQETVMADPTPDDLARWSQEQVRAAKAGLSPEVEAAIANWGADIDEADREAQVIARMLGIKEELLLSVESPEGATGVSAWWNPHEKVIGINGPAWKKDVGWNRLETIAHEVMHASQTLARHDWESGWSRYAALATAARDPSVERGSSEFWRRMWAYRHDPLEAEALAFGREYRDRRGVGLSRGLHR